MTKQEKHNPLIYLFKKTWRYSEGNRSKIVLFWTLFMAATGITLFGQPLVWAKIMNVVQEQGITKTSIKPLLMLLALTVPLDLAFWALHGPARVIEQLNAFRARANYRKHLLKGVLTFPLDWHSDHHSGDTIDKIEKGTSALFMFSEDSFEVIYLVAQLVGSYAMLAYFSPPSAYIVLAAICVAVSITMLFDRVLIRQYKELNRSENQISESVFDAVSNITTVIILRVERLVFGSIVNKVDKPYPLFRKNVWMSEMKWFLNSICAASMTVAVLAVYFYQHVGTAEGVLVGSVYLLVNYLRQLNELFLKFTGMYGDILRRKAKVLNAEEISKDFGRENFTNHVLPKDWRELAIRDLHFSYQSAEGGKAHLENIALSFSRSERVAFVGESGSGKTTLLKVMRDLYHPKGMELSVDGRVVPEGFAGISRAIALVPQHPELFARTIIENITLGAEYSMEVVRRFTDMACFTPVVERLPKGFDSLIREKGVNLSGGEKQRLALARGLLACADKDIVLLDEPTSSLDAATERSVYENILVGLAGKTIISSVHGLHLLPLFDRVCVFSGGTIVASGKPAELLATSPEFQRLWSRRESGSETGLVEACPLSVSV